MFRPALKKKYVGDEIEIPLINIVREVHVISYYSVLYLIYSGSALCITMDEIY